MTALALLAGPAAADPPGGSVGDITAEATSASGAAVSYDVSGFVDDNGPPAVACTPASGSTFALGTTAVSCVLTDTTTNETTNAGFNVTVHDTTAPSLSLPSPITVTATGPAGAVVTYSASASDLVDGAVTPSCAPASGSTFPVGATTVDCTAQDAAGNSASGNFSVTVQAQADTTPPTLTLPGPITVTATGPGAVVTYSASATDAVDGAVTPTCTPASGSTFPLGTTTVNCGARDAAGNATGGSFTVTVTPLPGAGPSPPSHAGDRTPPVITVSAPAKVQADGPPGATVDYSATAVDAVDGSVPVTCTPASGGVFAIGSTTVTCSATDTSGNGTSRSFGVTVVDQTPPPPVSAVSVKAAQGKATLRWRNPSSTDFDHVEVVRKRLPRGAEITLYRGDATTFTDGHALDGVDYEYIVFAVDAQGNRAGVAVAVRPRALVLVRPTDGAVVTSPPLLLWVPAPKADYYNVQLYRGSEKLLSVWPARNRYQLSAHWRFGRQTSSLAPGVYRWFVWPGYGPRRDRSFGGLLGTSTFVVSG